MHAWLGSALCGTGQDQSGQAPRLALAPLEIDPATGILNWPGQAKAGNKGKPRPRRQQEAKGETG